jgi:hypothetical protein
LRCGTRLNLFTLFVTKMQSIERISAAISISIVGPNQVLFKVWFAGHRSSGFSRLSCHSSIGKQAIFSPYVW